MNDRTGEIREMDPQMAAELNAIADKLSGRWVPIPEPELPAVEAMNRQQRRAWAKKQRRQGKK